MLERTQGLRIVKEAPICSLMALEDPLMLGLNSEHDLVE